MVVVTEHGRRGGCGGVGAGNFGADGVAKSGITGVGPGCVPCVGAIDGSLGILFASSASSRSIEGVVEYFVDAGDVRMGRFLRDRRQGTPVLGAGRVVDRLSALSSFLVSLILLLVGSDVREVLATLAEGAVTVGAGHGVGAVEHGEVEGLALGRRIGESKRLHC